jgi:hypothetical protein
MGIVDTSNVNWIASHSVDAETASQFAAILNEYRSPVSTRNYALAPAAPAPSYLNAEQAAKYQALVSSQGNDWGWQSLPQQLLTTVLDRISINADGSVNFDRLKGIPIGDYTVDMPAGASIQPLTLYYNSETGQYYVYTESGDSGYSSVFNAPAGGKILTQTVDYGWDAGIATTYTYIPGAQLLAEAASQQAVVDQLNALAAQTPVAPASFSADEAAKFDALVRGYGYSYAQMDTPYLKSLVDALSFRADGSLDFSRASGGLLGLGFTVPPDGAVLRDGSQIYQMQTVTTGGESEYTYQQRVDYLQGATIGADGTVSKNGVVLGHVSQQTSVIAAHNELIDYGEGGGHWEWVPETTITQTFFTASSAGVFVRDTLPANGLVALDIGDGNLRMGDDGRPDNAAYLYFNPLVGLVTPSANLHQDSDWFEAAFAVVFAVVVACIAPELIGVIGEALGASAATISTVTIAAETSGAISAAVTYAETGSITDAANAFSTGVVTGAVSAGVAAAVAPYAAELVSTMTDTTTAVGGTGITLGGVSSPATALATDASTLNGFLTNTISQGVANTVVNGGDFEQGFASAFYSSAGQFVAGNVNDYLPDAITGNKAAVKIVDSVISSGVTSLLSGESSNPANALISMAAGALVQNVMAPSNSSSISLVEPGATVRLGGESSPDPASPYSLTAGQTVRLGGETPVAAPTDSTSTSAPSGGAALDNGAGASPAPSTTPTDAGSTSPSGSVGDGTGWGGFFGVVNAGGANYLDPLAFSPPAASLFSDAGGALLGGMAGAAGNSAPNIGLAGDVTSDDASSGENSASAPKAPSPVAISGDASLNENVASLQASLNATPTQSLNIPQIGDATVAPNPDAGNAPRVYAVNMVTVKPGDTLWSLTNGSVAQIGYVSMTNGLNGSSLRAGDTINLGNFDPSSMTPAQLRAYESYGQAILNADNARLESLRQAALQAAAANTASQSQAAGAVASGTSVGTVSPTNAGPGNAFVNPPVGGAPASTAAPVGAVQGRGPVKPPATPVSLQDEYWNVFKSASAKFGDDVADTKVQVEIRTLQNKLENGSVLGVSSVAGQPLTQESGLKTIIGGSINGGIYVDEKFYRNAAVRVPVAVVEGVTIYGEGRVEMNVAGSVSADTSSSFAKNSIISGNVLGIPVDLSSKQEVSKIAGRIGGDLGGTRAYVELSRSTSAGKVEQAVGVERGNVAVKVIGDFLDMGMQALTAYGAVTAITDPRFLFVPPPKRP